MGLVALLFSRSRDALVNRLAAGEALFGAMPVGNRRFAQLPAQQDDLTVNTTGEIEKPDVEILDLHAGGIDLGDSVLDALDGFFALGFAAREVNDVEQRAAVQEDAMGCRLQLGVDFFDQLFALDRLLEQGLEDRQQALRFVEGEGLVGHLGLF